MKKLLILFCFLPFIVNGQISSGVVSSRGITAGTVLEALNFTTVYNFIQGPTGTWTGAATWDGGYGVATKNLTGDGWIEAEVTSTADYYFEIGLSTNNTLNVAPWDFTMFIYQGTFIARNIAGNFSDGVAASIGDKVRIKRTGTVITAEYYRGGTWTSVYTYLESSSATLYLKAQSAWDGYVVNSKGYNIH